MVKVGALELPSSSFTCSYTAIYFFYKRLTLWTPHGLKCQMLLFTLRTAASNINMKIHPNLSTINQIAQFIHEVLFLYVLIASFLCRIVPVMFYEYFFEWPLTDKKRTVIPFAFTRWTKNPGSKHDLTFLSIHSTLCRCVEANYKKD